MLTVKGQVGILNEPRVEIAEKRNAPFLVRHTKDAIFSAVVVLQIYVQIMYQSSIWIEQYSI